jgi:hypothetical protein
MATPHVAGAVALLWSAQPSLRNDIPLTETILNETAVHIASSGCSSPQTSPNNVFGYGRLDIKAAVDRALLRLTDVTTTGPDITVGFFAVTGRKYRLERKLEMTDSMWEDVPGDLTADVTGREEITDFGGAALGKAFYQVRLLP